MREAWLALVVLGPVLVGCIGATDDQGGTDVSAAGNASAEDFVPPAPNESFVGAIDADHADHHLPQLHTNTSGLEKVGYQSFQGFYPPDARPSWGEVDVHDGRELAAVSSLGQPIGATLVDVSDPGNPDPVSYTTSTGGDFDARITDGGEYLVLGCQAGPVYGPMRYAVGDCHGGTGPHAPETDASNTVSVWDISDPEKPEPVAKLATQGAHNVWTATIDGDVYAFTDAVEIIRFDPEASEGERLEVVAEVQGTHDVYVDEHPVTGDWLLYTGSPKDGSMAIYEVNDPSSPSPLVKEIDGVVGWHEQVASPTVIDGRVIAIGGGEDCLLNEGDAADAPRQKLTVVDVTDPENPKKLAEWKPPIEFQPPYTRCQFSAHNVDITPYGQVVSAWYHGGAWVFDVSTQERQENPVTLGFYQPHEPVATRAPPLVPFIDQAAVPLVWGPMWTDDGRIVLGDMNTGLYVLEPQWGLLPSPQG